MRATEVESEIAHMLARVLLAKEAGRPADPATVLVDLASRLGLELRPRVIERHRRTIEIARATKRGETKGHDNEQG